MTELVKRTCAYCHGEFVPTREDAKYCRPSCRKGAEHDGPRDGRLPGTLHALFTGDLAELPPPSDTRPPRWKR
jgi:hypothetical protein